MNVLTLKDGYKADHAQQYPEGTQEVYSNLTARKSRIPEITYTVVFGIQAFLQKFLMEEWGEFFKADKRTVVAAYKRRMDAYLGPDAISMARVEALHDLGYLPLDIKALPEGTLCPIGIPCVTIKNTHPDFYWLTNFMETLMSCELWHPMTVATIAYAYRRKLDHWARATGGDPNVVQFQGHDFSMRGHTSVETAMKAGAAHLLSFVGTDTIPAIDYLERYYGADATRELVGCSVPATEHSVMCLGGDGEAEVETIRRLITKVYPKGIVSVVSDTWDYWKVLTEYLPQLRSEILSREGKLVVRPDSGDPVKIICGDPTAPVGSPEFKGSVAVLHELFGGAKNAEGFYELNPRVGLIYGDSITLDRATLICMRLEERGYASTNVVLGIGSYSYQGVTRDTFGFAVKATHGVVNGEKRAIFKDPKTDDGTKKSARGYLRVEGNGNDLWLEEDVTEVREGGNLTTVYFNGQRTQTVTLDQIRKRLASVL